MGKKTGDHGVRRVLGLTALMVLLLSLAAGCATVTRPAPPPSAYDMWVAEDYQGLADSATRAANVGRVRVMVTTGGVGSYTFLTRTIVLGADGDPVAVLWLLAHEVSHHILGHAYGTLENEMAANAGAILVLQHWGAPRDAAIHVTQVMLLSAAIAATALPAHDWCAEYHAVGRTHPTTPDRRPPGVCGKDAGAP